MTLLYCKKCGDIKKIHKSGACVICDCGHSSARYSSSKPYMIVIFGYATILSIEGNTLTRALTDRDNRSFIGNIIPDTAKVLRKENV